MKTSASLTEVLVQASFSITGTSQKKWSTWFFTAEGKSHGQCCLDYRIAKACKPSSYNQLQAKLGMHDHHVVEGTAHSYIPVIGHDRQEDTLYSPKSQGNEELGQPP